jgi:hypothetical protein
MEDQQKIKILMTGIENREKLENDANNFCDQIEKQGGSFSFCQLSFNGSLMFLLIMYTVPAEKTKDGNHSGKK